MKYRCEVKLYRLTGITVLLLPDSMLVLLVNYNYTNYNNQFIKLGESQLQRTAPIHSINIWYASTTEIIWEMYVMYHVPLS